MGLAVQLPCHAFFQEGHEGRQRNPSTTVRADIKVDQIAGIANRAGAGFQVNGNGLVANAQVCHPEAIHRGPERLGEVI